MVTVYTHKDGDSWLWRQPKSGRGKGENRMDLDSGERGVGTRIPNKVDTRFRKITDYYRYYVMAEHIQGGATLGILGLLIAIL